MPKGIRRAFVCEIDGCMREHHCNGWCKPHYDRWERTGSVQADKPIRTVLPRSASREARFWHKVKRVNDCWEWTGKRDADGYGRFATETGETGAHRFSYQLLVGPVPDGLEVCHHCDNPPCVNPDHLWVGTHTENMADMIAKGRRRTGPRTYFNVVSSTGPFRVPRAAA